MYVDKSTLKKENTLNLRWILPHTTLKPTYLKVLSGGGKWVSVYENTLELLLNVNHS